MGMIGEKIMGVVSNILKPSSNTVQVDSQPVNNNKIEIHNYILPNADAAPSASVAPVQTTPSAPAAAGGSKSTVTGDIEYTLYGKKYVDNQANFMYHVFAQVLKRHQDKIKELPEQRGMNCVSHTNYKIAANKDEKWRSYFRACLYFEFDNGENLCVGTAYAWGEKENKVRRLLEICGESNSGNVSWQAKGTDIAAKNVRPEAYFMTA